MRLHLVAVGGVGGRLVAAKTALPTLVGATNTAQIIALPRQQFPRSRGNQADQPG